MPRWYAYEEVIIREVMNRAPSHYVRAVLPRHTWEGIQTHWCLMNMRGGTGAVGVRPAHIQTLFDRRVELGLTQTKVADRLGIAKTTFHNYETGARSPTVNTLARWAKVLGLQLTFAPVEERSAKAA